MPGLATELEILVGGREVKVTRKLLKADGTPSVEGDKMAVVEENVKVRLMTSVREMPKLVVAWTGDDIGLITFLTGKDSAWVDALTIDSQFAVLEEGRDLNFPHFTRWFAAQTRSLEAMNQTPMVKQAIADAVKELDASKSERSRSRS